MLLAAIHKYSMRKWINLLEYADPDKRQSDTFAQGSAHYSPDLKDREGFSEWFAGSKVCGPTGDPLIAFHGSFEQFTEFKHQSDNRRSYGFNRLGFWFDVDPRTPEYFAGGKSIMPCVLSIKNPFHLDSEFIYTPDIEELRTLSADFKEVSGAKMSARRDNLGNLVDREGNPIILKNGKRLNDDLYRTIERAHDEKRREILSYENEASQRIDGFHSLMKMLPRGAKSTDAEVDAFKADLIQQGYDGIYLGDTAADFATRDYVGTDWWIAFRPNQIKSIFAKSFSDSPNIML